MGNSREIALRWMLQIATDAESTLIQVKAWGLVQHVITWVNVDQDICHLIGTRPLSESVMVYCKLNPYEQTSVNFWSNFKHWTSFKKMHFKMSVRPRHFCLDLNVLTMVSCVISRTGHCFVRRWIPWLCNTGPLLLWRLSQPWGPELQVNTGGLFYLHYAFAI